MSVSLPVDLPDAAAFAQPLPLNHGPAHTLTIHVRIYLAQCLMPL